MLGEFDIFADISEYGSARALTFADVVIEDTEARSPHAKGRVGEKGGGEPRPHHPPCRLDRGWHMHFCSPTT